MAKNVIKNSPFTDAIGKDTVPQRGTGKGTYDNEPNVGLPQREGGLLPELFRDTTFGSPKFDGPITRTPYKDKVK